MNNTKDEIKNCFPIDYIHVLKMNQKGQKYLKTIKKTCSYHIITNLSSYKHPALDLEIKSSKLLSLIDHQMIKKNFKIFLLSNYLKDSSFLLLKYVLKLR